MLSLKFEQVFNFLENLENIFGELVIDLSEDLKKYQQGERMSYSSVHDQERDMSYTLIPTSDRLYVNLFVNNMQVISLEGDLEKLDVYIEDTVYKNVLENQIAG